MFNFPWFSKKKRPLPAHDKKPTCKPEMRSFDSEFSPFWGGPTKLPRRSFHSFTGGKRPPMIYMVPTTPTKPAFLMKPNNYRPPASCSGAPYLANEYPAPNSFGSNCFASPYPSQKFERFPQIGNNNFAPAPIEPITKPWYLSDDTYLDENARNARKLLNEIDIKAKMKKYDTNELFNTEMLESLDTKPNESSYHQTSPGCHPMAKPDFLASQRRYPATTLGLHRSNSSLPNRYGPSFPSHGKRLNNFFLDEGTFIAGPSGNGHPPNHLGYNYSKNYAIDNSSNYLDEMRYY